ncbi:hypothetical protein EDB19DRAFT_1898406 [Suillus lakei]|nr:hypothetical protein EDB19DRAFT_1898406 [Suillus lakei]
MDEFLKLPIPSFHNNQSFLQKVDELPHGPAWSCKKLLHKDVKLWMHYRKHSCDPMECIKDLIGNPLFKKHMAYAPTRLPKGVTITPIILASDKTCLLQFQGNKSMRPVYLLIGNIKMKKRREMYLPTGKLNCCTLDACSLASYCLFYYCMSLLLQLLIAAGQDGVEMLILAAYVADFPEQCLVACCKENCCTKCLVAANERGDLLSSPMQDPQLIKELTSCTDIFLAFISNLLHQLHKGVFKDHLIKWYLDIHFKNGKSAVKQWTGIEHKQMQHVFIGLLAGVSSVGSCMSYSRFSYYTQLQIHTADSLNCLESTISVFHANRYILHELEVHEHFNIPKLHQLLYYVQSISLFGTTDTYCASNKCDYEEQMALWLQCQEAVFLCSSYLE